eukprot:TRINITY_DN1635_c0_g1_i9.p1 TRINITY_DN1635_c0_g1~~TRINITY_DN1635_c0_g1_i9.p1  ORF type:complete len:143 (+),score=18.56 TRINITY_DN1635_c0_g1_i9:806-1234(+)
MKRTEDVRSLSIKVDDCLGYEKLLSKIRALENEGKELRMVVVAKDKEIWQLRLEMKDKDGSPPSSVNADENSDTCSFPEENGLVSELQSIESVFQSEERVSKNQLSVARAQEAQLAKAKNALTILHDRLHEVCASGSCYRVS